MKKIYLASPYTHGDPKVKRERYEEVCKKVGAMTLQGYIVYSPIANCHSIAVNCNLPDDFDFWKPLNRSLIAWADEVAVFMIDGWEDSTGIAQEIQLALEIGKPVSYEFAD